MLQRVHSAPLQVHQAEIKRSRVWNDAGFTTEIITFGNGGRLITWQITSQRCLGSDAFD